MVASKIQKLYKNRLKNKWILRVVTKNNVFIQIMAKHNEYEKEFITLRLA